MEESLARDGEKEGERDLSRGGEWEEGERIIKSPPSPRSPRNKSN